MPKGPFFPPRQRLPGRRSRRSLRFQLSTSCFEKAEVNEDVPEAFSQVSKDRLLRLLKPLQGPDSVAVLEEVIKANRRPGKGAAPRAFPSEVLRAG